MVSVGKLCWTERPARLHSRQVTSNLETGSKPAALRADAWWLNSRDLSWACEPTPADVLEFHRSLSGYAPTPLVELPALAAELRVGRVFVKDESERLGLPAFKALGASWAVHKALEQRSEEGEVVLVTATDGNHGRAVARAARQLGHRAHVVVAEGVHPNAVSAIRDEGAEVTEANGTYDDAVAQAIAAAEAPGAILVQDTAWPGYERIPAWIVQGYTTLVREVDEQLHSAGVRAADLMVVPVGVGSLAQAVVMHYRSLPEPSATSLLTVEPDTAACLLASLRAGEPVTVTTGLTVMTGLNCGTLSSGAWPFLRDGIDAAVAVSDRTCLAAMCDLHDLGVDAGPCGAASLAASRHALAGEGQGADQRRAALGVDSDSVVVLLSTEGSGANPTSE